MTLEEYQALLRASPYLYLVMAPDLTILAASEAYLRFVGRKENEIVGRNVFEAFPEDPSHPGSTNVAEVKASMLRALAKRETDTSAFVRYAVQVETSAGRKFEERYWSTVHTPVMDANGQPMLLVQNPIDVTDLYRFNEHAEVATLHLTQGTGSSPESFNQAQMHEALSRILNNEREHLRSLFNQAPGFVAVLMGPKHVFELVNQAYYQLVGHRELIGKTVWDALPEVAGQGYEEFLDEVYRTGHAWTTRARPISIQRVPGGHLEQRYIDLVYQPYKDRYGATIGIFAQGYDVTDAVEAQEAKRESEERLRDGLDAAKMLVWDWDLQSGKLAYSENVESVMGFRPETMESVTLFIHPDDRGTIQEAHSQALSTGGSYQAIIRFFRPDDGRQIWVDSRGRVRCRQDGKPTGIRGVTVDVTERHKAEIELREVNRRKDEFLAMLAHELRNPLAPISTAAQMLEFVGSSDPRIAKACGVILRQVRHMTALVDDLLEVSRVTRGLVQLDLQPVVVKTVIVNAVEQVKPLIEAKGQDLVIHDDVECALVRGDHHRLVQIIANLLNNAAKYTPAGGQIALLTSTDKGNIHIRVADDGIGIDQQLLPHIFDLFTQAERTPDRTQGGLGIGLALVKNLVGLHGGTITAQSAGHGLGSKFDVKLPLLTMP